MIMRQILDEKNMTLYAFSEKSKIPYTTVRDICCGKTDIKKCSFETVYKIAKALDISIDKLYELVTSNETSFELFKSSVCHELKGKGDKNFLIDILKGDPINKYYNNKQYKECFYLLAMLDYVSRINGIPLYSKYDNLRCMKLQTVVYPSGIIIESILFPEKPVKANAYNSAIPEFKKFNIVESDVRNVV